MSDRLEVIAGRITLGPLPTADARWLVAECRKLRNDVSLTRGRAFFLRAAMETAIKQDDDMMAESQQAERVA